MGRIINKSLILLVMVALFFSSISSSSLVNAFSGLIPSPVTGQVIDAAGNGIANVTILAVEDPLKIYLPNIIRPDTSAGSTVTNPPESGQNYYTVETNENGFFSLASLPPGRYVISARKLGQDFSPLSYIVKNGSTGGEFNFEETVIPTVYTPGTITLSDETLAQLVSISNDGTTYTFAAETSDLSQVHVGDVLIGNISTLTPDGFLRKVTSITTNGDQPVFITEPATLEDGFVSLSIQTTQQLTSAQVQSLTDIPGITLLQAPAMAGMGNFEFSLNNAVLYDKDGNLSTTVDQVVANGLLTLSPEIEFRIRIENGTLEELYFITSMNVDTGFTISSELSMEIPLIEAKLIPTIYLTPMPVGPIVLTPQIDLVAGITGNIFSGVSASVSNTTTATAGLWHVDQNTRNLSKFTSNFSFTPITCEHGLSFKAFLGPKISVKVYGIVGAYGLY
jgi:hypothetical protein